VTPLSPARARELAAAPYTYDEVGATQDELPGGYRHVRVSRTVDVPFVAAAELLMTWQVPQRVGIKVAASSPRAEAGAVTEMRWLGLRIPCRVVYVVAEPDRVGFAYGTLPGHPEHGEEAFVIERGAGDSVTFRITAFSRPVSVLARAGAPVARRVQDLMTERYLRSLG
jgi:uncharacterized protein (UPF0548 family)